MSFRELADELMLASGQNKLTPTASRYTIFGSAVMYLHGLRQKVGDVDLFVTPALYSALRERGWKEQWPKEGDPPLLECKFRHMPPAHAFYAWKGRGMPINVAEMLGSPRMVDGWPVQRLSQLREWKLSISFDPTRPNDFEDVIAIDSYLEKFPGA